MVSTRRKSASAPSCWSCRRKQSTMMREVDLVVTRALRGFDITPACSSRRALALGTPDTHKSVSRVGVYTGGGYPPWQCPFSSLGCRRCRCTEGFLIWGSYLITPGCGGASALSRGVRLPSRWLDEQHPYQHQQSADGDGLSTPCGAVSTW